MCIESVVESDQWSVMSDDIEVHWVMLAICNKGWEQSNEDKTIINENKVMSNE